MKRHRKRTGNASIDDIVAITRENSDSPHVVVGPLLWREVDGTSAKMWYFVIASSERGRGFRCDQIIVADQEHGELERMCVIGAFCLHRPALVIHDTDDELTMAKLCEALWPGQRITRLREGVERERQELAS